MLCSMWILGCVFCFVLFVFLLLASHQILLWLCWKCLLKQGSPGHVLMFFKAQTHKWIKELQDAEMPVLCLWCRQGSSTVRLLTRLFLSLCLHAFFKSKWLLVLLFNCVLWPPSRRASYGLSMLSRWTPMLEIALGSIPHCMDLPGCA